MYKSKLTLMLVIDNIFKGGEVWMKVMGGGACDIQKWCGIVNDGDKCKTIFDGSRECGPSNIGNCFKFDDWKLWKAFTQQLYLSQVAKYKILPQKNLNITYLNNFSFYINIKSEFEII